MDHEYFVEFSLAGTEWKAKHSCKKEFFLDGSEGKTSHSNYCQLLIFFLVGSDIEGLNKKRRLEWNNQ